MHNSSIPALSLSDHLWHAITANDRDDDGVGDNDDDDDDCVGDDENNIDDYHECFNAQWCFTPLSLSLLLH